MPRIAPVRSVRDLAAIRALFHDYGFLIERDVGISLAFQNFAAEMANLPGDYAPPKGDMFLARDETDRPVACVAYRPQGRHACEVKRLYVSPTARGGGLGRCMVHAVLEAARVNGYRRIVLDTALQLRSANALYEKLGFLDIAPYNDSPLADMRYMALDL